MQRVPYWLAIILAVSLTVGCETVTPAPGAEKLKITRNPTDVANCKTVGNVVVPKDANGTVNGWTSATEFRNKTLGLGGNVAFVTVGTEGMPAEGVAYHCD